jgi:hypothetical protein
MIRISFLGDVSLNDKYNEYYNNRLTPFTQIGSYISKSDFIVANLECMSVGNDGENFLKKPRLKTDNKTLFFLKDIGITTVTLGHNHIYDNLESDFKNRKYLWKIYWLKHKHYNPIKFYFFRNSRNPFKQLKKLGFKKIINYILKKVKGKI